MDEMTQQLNIILRVNKADLTPKISVKKREDRINEAVAWNSGDNNNLEYHTIFSEGEYSIRLGKPGKEASPTYNMCKYKDGHKGNNPNDMRPTIFKNGILQENQVASFTEIFNELQKLGREDEYSLELIACLLFRSAYMIDHIENPDGVWRYSIPEEIINKISEKLPLADNIPTKVFLHFLDALAWNEDVKYKTLGFEIKDGTGRKNNLLTCVNLIGVLLNRVSISKFAGSFSRPPIGISAISNKEAFHIFPLLVSQE